MSRAEDRRQFVHAAMTLWVVTLRWLPEWGALALAGAAILVNWVVLPAAGLDRSLRRPGGPWLDGVKLYPLAVLLVLLLFPTPTAAAAWAVLGIADAASNVAGRSLGRPGFLGRPDRSLAGSVAFVVTGAPAAVLAHAWVAAAGPSTAVVAAAVAAAVAGAAVELLVPRGLDDNLAIALAAGAAFHATAAGLSAAPA